MSDDDRDDDDDKPAKFSSLLGPKPTWLRCACGELTARVPCWDCERTKEASRELDGRRKAALATIPPRFLWARLGDADLAGRVKLQEPLDVVAKRVLASNRVVFAGPSGSGKTSFAVACLRERVPHGMFVSAMKLGTARIQSRAGDGEADLVERAMAARLLLVDEVGGEQKTANNAVKDVIWTRYDNDLPTWITTGFRGAELVAMYGDGAFRRLTEGVTVIQFGTSR